MFAVLGELVSVCVYVCMRVGVFECLFALVCCVCFFVGLSLPISFFLVAFASLVVCLSACLSGCIVVCVRICVFLCCACVLQKAFGSNSRSFQNHDVQYFRFKNHTSCKQQSSCGLTFLTELAFLSFGPRGIMLLFSG